MKKMIRRAVVASVAVMVVVGMVGPASGTEIDPADTIGRTKVIGVLTVLWGDPMRGQSGSANRFVLHPDDGQAIEVAIGSEMAAAVGGAKRLHGRRVAIAMASALHGQTVAVAQTLELLPVAGAPEQPDAITGPQPWVSLLCKFSDVSAEPRNLSYFQGMYSSSWPGLDHYWRQLSYNTANVAGSTAVAWVTLPQPVSYYETAGGGNLNAMVNDCTAAADSAVYFPNFVGINMMFNDTFGPYAWGGGRYLTLDGASKYYRVTWEPPWGYQNVAVIAHEMGHGFGLPHSNNADGDGNPYDNPWDVMSDSWYWAVSDPTYGTVGKGTISYHLDKLGWIAPQHKLDIDATGLYDVVINHLRLQSTSNLRMVEIGIPNSTRYYTVEVRDQVGYDGGLPGFAVIIHEVNTGRSEDAWLIDAENPANGADEGAMWRVGECFEDAANEISVCVMALTAEGFRVQLGYGDTGTVFHDGFESNGFGGWSRVSE